MKHLLFLEIRSCTQLSNKILQLNMPRPERISRLNSSSFNGEPDNDASEYKFPNVQISVSNSYRVAVLTSGFDSARNTFASVSELPFLSASKPGAEIVVLKEMYPSYEKISPQSSREKFVGIFKNQAGCGSNPTLLRLGHLVKSLV